MALHPQELEADMQEVYGIDMSRAEALGYTVAHVSVLAAMLPPTSRVWVAEDADNAWGLSDVLAASTLNQIRALASDGKHKVQLVGPSWMRKGKHKEIKGIAMTPDELLAALSRPRAEMQKGGNDG